jgi:hypothetical protein
MVKPASARRRYRSPLVGVAAVVFFGYLVWSAHTPGEPRTVRDFLFLLALTGIPFLLLLYDVWSWISWEELAAQRSRRTRLALAGSMMGGASAAMLVLLLPIWEFAVQHEKLGASWVGTGMLMALAATVCGIAGASRLRWLALLSAILLPFWLFASALLLKALLD